MDSIELLQFDQVRHSSWLQSLFTRYWLTKNPTFVCSCRVLVDRSGYRELYRFVYSSPDKNLTTAELDSERIVSELLSTKLQLGETVELQWKRPRIVTAQTFDSETDSVKSVLIHIKRNASKHVVFYERVSDFKPLTERETVISPQSQQASYRSD